MRAKNSKFGPLLPLYLEFTTDKPGPFYALNLEIWPHFENICPSLV